MTDTHIGNGGEFDPGEPTESDLATLAYMAGQHSMEARIRVLEAENAALREALEPFAAGPCLCGEIYRAASVAVCHPCKARAALQHKEPQG